MSDLNESYRDDGPDHNEVGPEVYGPNDDVTAAFGDGQYKVAGLGPKGRDETAFARRPEVVLADQGGQAEAVNRSDDVVQAASHKLVDHEVKTVGAADAASDSPIVDIRPIVVDARVDMAVELPKVDDAALESEFDLEACNWLEPEVVHQANVLLRMNEQLQNSPKHDGDDYLRDASGHVKQVVKVSVSRTSSMSSDYRFGAMCRATVDLTGYAIRTGNETAARFGYDSLPQSDRWLMYAEAYETSGIDPKLIAEWRRGLDVAHEQAEGPEDTATQASRLFALTMGKVHDYTSIPDPVRLAARREQRGAPPEGDGTGPSLEALAAAREEHKQMAVEYAIRLHEALGSIRQSDGKGSFAYLRRTWSPGQFDSHTILSFARAGIYEGIAVADSRYPDKHTQGLIQMAKAVHGELGRVELQKLRFSGDTGKLLRWLNDVQSSTAGDVGDPPRVNRNQLYQHTVNLLEQLVPARMRQLGLPFSSEFHALRVALSTEDYESVRTHYVALLGRNGFSEDLTSALMISQHLHEVQATGAAHEIFEGDFLKELEPVEARLKGLFDADNEAAMADELGHELAKLHEDSKRLKDPVTSLHAKARLATMLFKAAPNGERVGELMGDIQTQWDVLECREGGDQELVRLHHFLRSSGLHLEPQWKMDGTDGYIGYRPSSSLLSRRNISDFQPLGSGKCVDIGMVKEYVDTTAALNDALGTERYVLEIAREDMEQLEELRTFLAQRSYPWEMFLLRYTKQPVYVNGPWRTLYSTDDKFVSVREFERAADNIRTGWTFLRSTAKSEHLRQLIEGAEADWQREHGDD